MRVYSKKSIMGGMLLALGARAPLSAAIDDLLITEVDPVGNLAEVTNTSNVGFTTASMLWFCHQFNYGSTIPSGTTFGPGESKTFTVSDLIDGQGDLWLYRNSSFADPANIINGLQYGSGGSFGRTSIAVSVGKWSSTSDFVPAPPAGETMQANSLTPTSPAGWINRAPTSNAFFGTGTAIVNPIPAPITKGSSIVELQLLVDDLPSPVGVVPQPDGADRLYVYDQTGIVVLVDNGAALPTPFMDASGELVTLQAGFDERGFIGLALHPNFPATPNIYTYTSEPVAGTPDFALPAGATTANNHAVISEWTLDAGNPDAVDMASKRELLRIADPQFNHNGGTMNFGPDGYLYIALGDGGGRDDEGDGHVAEGNGQDPTNLFGSILRIDVGSTPGNALSANGQYRLPADNPFVGSSGLDEIFAHGLRNPFIFSFDSQTGLLYSSDVGQDQIEEVNIINSGGNYGWPFKEGSFYFDQNGSSNGFVTNVPVSEPPPEGTFTDPIAQYDHDEGISIIGGFVYRGTALPSLVGKYICGDFSTSFGTPAGRLFALDLSTNTFEELQIGTDDRALGLFLKGFGQDSDGELYICGTTSLGPTGTTGDVHKLVSEATNVQSWTMY